MRACTGIDQMTPSHTAKLPHAPAGPSNARSAEKLVGTRSPSLATNTSVAPTHHQPRRLQPPLTSMAHGGWTDKQGPINLRFSNHEDKGS
jgi:hypothetical protein